MTVETRDHPLRHKVDPAALLVAVFAVGAGPLLQSGSWSYLNSVTAIVVLVVVIYFSWPTTRLGGLSAVGCAVYALVYGFILAIGFAWPIQAIFGRLVHQDDCYYPNVSSEVQYFLSYDCRNGNVDRITDMASGWGMLCGAMSAVAMFLALGGLCQVIQLRNAKAPVSDQDLIPTEQGLEPEQVPPAQDH